MFEAYVQRVLEGLSHFNTIAMPIVRIRFQVAPGTGTGLGISGVPFQVQVGGVPVHAGNTDANGEVTVPIPFIAVGNCSLRIFDSDFPLDFQAALDPVANVKGQLQRLDQMGYVTGYQLDDTIEPSVEATRATPRSRQATLNLQADSDIAIDDDIGPQTRTQLTTKAGQ
jgi:hypothetical protein